MNIGRINQILENYQSQSKPLKPLHKQAGGGAKDEILISSEGRILDQFKKQAAQMPDVREDRVAALSQMIEEGKYNIPANVLAAKMLESN